MIEKVRRPKGRPQKIAVDGSTFAAQFGVKIKETRQRIGWTQDDVVQAAGGIFNCSMLSSYELGKALPSLPRYIALCMALGLPLYDLIPDNVREALKKPLDIKNLAKILDLTQ
jgi:transcriptional regulator with XRE-family HTH domain